MRRLRPTSISETDLASVEIWRGIYLQVLSWRQSRPRSSARLSRLRFEQAAASGRGANRTARRPSINSTASRPWRVVSLRAFRLGEIMYLQRLASYGVSFHSYTEAQLATDNEMVRNILLSVMSSLAKVETQKIGERTRAGMARAKAQGKHIGRPPL